MDSEVSRDPLAGHILNITFTCKAHNYIHIIITIFYFILRLNSKHMAVIAPFHPLIHTIIEWFENNVFQFPGQ